MSTSVRKKVLVVEDEPMIAEAVATRLTAQGYAVSTAPDGPSGERMFSEVQPDLVVLDVMLPGFDGLELCRRIQAARAVPVLMLTARDDEADIVMGLAVGADDYLTKPFGMKELIARCGALLRRVERSEQLSRSSSVNSSRVVWGDLGVDVAGRQAWRGDEEVRLTSTEFELMTTLMAQPDVVLTRDDLMQRVWDWADARGTRTLDSHIKALRAKIGAERIRTSHGVGYAWVSQP